MTKERAPCSIENALYRVLGALGIERAAEVTERTEGYLRALSDPERREQLTVRDLELLDLAHDGAHGTGFPLFEALGRRLGTARGERFSDAAAIGRHAVDVARENGEACAALLAAALAAGSDPKALERALRETEDVHRVATEALATIRAAIARSAAGQAQGP